MGSELIAAAKGLKSWVFNEIQPEGGRILRTPEEIREMIRQNSDGYSGNLGVVSVQNAMAVAAVFACVNVLARTVAMLPARLYRVKDERHVLTPEHPLSKILGLGPNQWQTPFEFWQMVITHILLRGNFYALKARVNDRLTGLLFLDPDRVTPEWGSELEPVYKYLQPDGRRVTFRREDIFHARGLCVDGLKGLSVLQQARNTIGFSVRAEEHGNMMFSNGARPSGVLHTDQALNDEAYERLRSDFENKYVGSGNAHRPMILEAGLKWQQMSLSAEDAQFIEQRKFARSEIAMFFGVPPHMIGDIERGTSWGSGLEQQNMGFLIHTIMPYLVNLQQAIIRDLLLSNEQTKYVVKFDTAILSRADFIARQNGLEVMRRNGVINADEWRKIEGYDPIGDEQSGRYVTPGQSSQGQGTGQTQEPPSEA